LNTRVAHWANHVRPQCWAREILPTMKKEQRKPLPSCHDATGGVLYIYTPPHIGVLLLVKMKHRY